MGNCYGTPVVNHHTPCSTKPLSSELLNKDDKQNGPPIVKNGDMLVAENTKAAVETGSSNEHDLTLPPSGKIVTPNLKLFTLAELKAATGNFKPATVLGEGGFGRVFKGWVDEKTYAPSKVGVGMAVAVKKSNPDSLQGLKEWQAEIKFLGKFSHPNLVKLLGYCWEENQFLLVYEYMQKGSLETHIFRKGVEPLPWETRLKIATGAAQGLAFLHTSEKSVIYRDFKAANILLDGAYNAKLSDFGLAKQGPINGESHVSTRLMGTHGYAAPEYIATGHLYVKSDVYGFGVVLLEMLAGMRTVDTNRPSDQLNLVEWAKPSLSQKKKLKKIMDPRLEDKYPITGAMQVAEVIIKCLESDPKKRPSMEEVLEKLQKASAMKGKLKETNQPSGSSTSHQNPRNSIHSRYIGAGAASRVHLHSKPATRVHLHSSTASARPC